jgi:hypothetical protein
MTVSHLAVWGHNEHNLTLIAAGALSNCVDVNLSKARSVSGCAAEAEMRRAATINPLIVSRSGHVHVKALVWLKGLIWPKCQIEPLPEGSPMKVGVVELVLVDGPQA